MICFRHKDPKNNFGLTMGRENAVTFKNGNGYLVFSDGSFQLVKENCQRDEELFEREATKPDGILIKIEFKDIQWIENNILNALKLQ